MPIFYCTFNHKNFISKYHENAVIDFAHTSRTSLNEQCWKKASKPREILLQVKYLVTSLRRYMPSVVSLIDTRHNKLLSLSNTAVVVIFTYFG